MSAHAGGTHLTKAFVHLERLTHNLRLLQAEAGGTELWPVVKADAYGHGADIVTRHLLGLGYRRFGVADVGEVMHLREQGIEATFVVLVPTVPADSEALVAHGCEPVVCTREMADALSRAAARVGRPVSVHLVVDTGMGRIGIRPQEVEAFLAHCRGLPSLRVAGLMSHFPSADHADKTYSRAQIERFRGAVDAARAYGAAVCHMANSAAILDLPEARFDAVRPGIAVYGLAPSREIANPRVRELEPVLEWKTQITFLKEVPAGTGLSYGHTFHTERPSLIATIPAGYGDGLARRLSNTFEVLVGGRRCPGVGRITMDMSLVDVTALRGRVAVGDEVVLIGRQGTEEVTADELAARLDTINYEIVTRIGARVPRVAIAAEAPSPRG